MPRGVTVANAHLWNCSVLTFCVEPSRVLLWFFRQLERLLERGSEVADPLLPTRLVQRVEDNQSRFIDLLGGQQP